MLGKLGAGRPMNVQEESCLRTRTYAHAYTVCGLHWNRVRRRTARVPKPNSGRYLVNTWTKCGNVDGRDAVGGSLGARQPANFTVPT